MPANPSTSPSLKILVVDDEEPIRLILETLLVLTGHKVGLASDGFAACAMFRSDTWDLVLIDRHMPTMIGDELARLLKALSPETPVIMVTGCPPPDGCAEVDAYIAKPFTLDTISQAIARCLATRESHRSRLERQAA